MLRISRRYLLFAMFAPLALLLLWPTQAQKLAPTVVQPAAGGTRGPAALLFAPDGRTLYVAEQDENQIAILDPDGSRPIAHIASGGEQPVGLGLVPKERTLIAVNSFSGSIGIIDLDKRLLRTHIPLPGMPYDVAIATNGQAFVSISQRNEIAVVDLASNKVVLRIPVGRRPRALRMTPDGHTVVCAGMEDGSLSLVDVATTRERTRIKLPAINLRGLVLSADGEHAYVTAQQPHNELPTDKPEAMWTNVLCIVQLTGENPHVERVVPLDEPDHGAADPCGIALNAKGDTAYVALSGSQEMAVIPLTDNAATAIHRFPVGVNPRPVALRPGNSQVWIGNHLGNSLTKLYLDTSAVQFVDLGPPTPSPNRRLKGRFLFSSARLARGMRFSCETCHPDGGTDGLSWKFSHVMDAPEVRNTRDLRGPLLLTGPYGWSAREQDFEVFVNDEIIGLMKTHRLAHSDLHAFWDLVNETPLPPNPYRKPDGGFTASAERGKTLFEGKAGCLPCHAGGQNGGSGSLAWIGTTPNGVKLDIPHLIGVYDSAPYLHDGRAATLEEIFTKYNPDHLHGGAHELSPPQLQDLLAYVREL